MKGEKTNEPEYMNYQIAKGAKLYAYIIVE